MLSVAHPLRMCLRLSFVNPRAGGQAMPDQERDGEGWKEEGRMDELLGRRKHRKEMGWPSQGVAVIISRGRRDSRQETE